MQLIFTNRRKATDVHSSILCCCVCHEEVNYRLNRCVSLDPRLNLYISWKTTFVALRRTAAAAPERERALLARLPRCPSVRRPAARQDRDTANSGRKRTDLGGGRPSQRQPANVTRVSRARPHHSGALPRRTGPVQRRPRPPRSAAAGAPRGPFRLLWAVLPSTQSVRRGTGQVSGGRQPTSVTSACQGTAAEA